MTNRFFLTFALVFGLVSPALAQNGPAHKDCTVQPELIFQLSRAEYGAYNVWDATFGEMETDERFISGVVIDNGDVVGLSELTSFGKPDRTVQLAEFDNRGRVVWKTAQAVQGLASIQKLLRQGDGFVAMGTSRDTKSRGGIWLGFFDKAGKMTGQKTIMGKGSLLPEDIIPQINGNGFLVAASAGEDSKSVIHSILYHLDAKGKVIDQQAYMPGLDNRIVSLSPVGRDYYMASGYLRGEDGRITGWIMELNKDGSLVWQRQYPRGASAQINKAIPMIKDYILAAGETTPLDKGNMAAWVMMIDGNNGDVIWQRYYTGDMKQSARDILVNMEGLATVMVQNSKADDAELSENNQDYIRLLTVNQRGVLSKSDEFFNAEGAQASQMIGGHAGERIMLGRTDMVYKIEPKPGQPVETLKHGWDAWVAAAAPMEPFADDCLADTQP